MHHMAQHDHIKYSLKISVSTTKIHSFSNDLVRFHIKNLNYTVWYTGFEVGGIWGIGRVKVLILVSGETKSWIGASVFGSGNQ